MILADENIPVFIAGLIAEAVAYGIDKSVEGHSNEAFKEILKECGLEENIIETWNKRGWLRP